ncbi:hypothetical protein MBLNU459_g4602t1 [Dothideomycetes sp. NU459]
MDRPSAPSTYLNYRNSTQSQMPSFPNPPASPARPPLPAVAASAAIQFSATLLILVSDAPSPHLQTYLSAILTRYAVTEAALMATSNAALKSTRMDVYTAAGKMRQDILVSTTLLDKPLGPHELEKACVRGLAGKTLCGVLLCQHSGVGWVHVERDVLDFGAAEMEESWRTHILTLHTLARHTVPLLRRASSKSSPFFYLDSTLPLSPLDSATQSSLLDALSRTSLAQGLQVGHAKEELATTEVEQPNGLDIPRNGHGDGTGNSNGVYGANGAGYGGFTPTDATTPLSESPTKLWASWAMMNE